MSSLILKIIAMIFMTIDHAGVVLFDNNDILIFFGRIAFPLYGFLLVEGYTHTKNKLKYFILILSLAFISEVIYDKVFYDYFIYLGNQNILFTLSIALICMYIYESNSRSLIGKIISILIVIYISILSEFLFVDYGFLGISLIFSYYLIRNLKNKKIFYVLVTVIYLLLRILIYGFNIVSLGVLLSIIPILLYNGNKGYNLKIIKYIFYIYYPLHLIILLILKII